jgi:hypothetical protein
MTNKFTKSICVEVDRDTYNALKEEQSRVEDETGEKKSLSSILLEFAQSAIFDEDEEENEDDENEEVEDNDDNEGEDLPEDLESQRERVLYIIEDQGMSLDEFAKSLDMTPTYVETILDDEDYDDLPVSLLLKVLQVYGEEYGNDWIKSNE